MTSLNLILVGLFLGSFSIGGSCLFLVHCRCRVLSRIGRHLFVAVLLALGVAGFMAAVVCAEGLAPLGLLAGLLVVAMLCEWPVGEVEHSASQ